MPVRVEATSCTALAFERHKLAAAVASHVVAINDVPNLIKMECLSQTKVLMRIVCAETVAMQEISLVFESNCG